MGEGTDPSSKIIDLKEVIAMIMLVIDDHPHNGLLTRPATNGFASSSPDLNSYSKEYSNTQEGGTETKTETKPARERMS